MAFIIPPGSDVSPVLTAQDSRLNICTNNYYFVFQFYIFYFYLFLLLKVFCTTFKVYFPFTVITNGCVPCAVLYP